MQTVQSIPIDEATDEQLRTFASNFLNLDLAATATPTEVRAAIDRAQPGAAIIFGFTNQTEEELVLGGDEAPPAIAGQRQEGSLGQHDPRAIIEIPVVETDDNSGQSDVLVGINGRAWQLKRGVPLSVPWRVVLGLQDAISTQVTHDQEGNESFRDAKRFPFHFLEKPSQADIDAWHQRVDAEFCA